MEKIRDESKLPEESHCYHGSAKMKNKRSEKKRKNKRGNHIFFIQKLGTADKSEREGCDV
jgi:hypothetical protein